MEEIANLKIKKDQVLILELKDLVATERRVLTKILHYLREIEVRKLYLGRGCPSLFAMLTQELGYSESAAGRRIQAMRLIKEIPQVEAKIEKGTISLSVASQMQSFIRNEDKRRMEENSPKLSPEEKITLVEQVEGSSARECERKLLDLSPEAALPKEKTKPISPNKTLIQFVADEALMKGIERLKELMSHKNPTGKYEQLFSELVKLGLDKLDPERREVRRNQRKEKLIKKKIHQLPALGVATPLSLRGGPLAPHCGAGEPTKQSRRIFKKLSRHIPQKLRDQIWIRDQGCCQYKDPETGKLCGSRHFTQMDHRFPYSLGGEHSLKNLRLRCFVHNKLHAAQTLGEFPLKQ